jgi:uncharacterized protein (DUF111 family)
MISGISGDMTLAAILQIKNLSSELSAIFSEIFGFPVNLSLKEKYVNAIKAYQLKIDLPNKIRTDRDFKSIRNLIENSKLDDCVKKDSIGIFSILANAESNIHGINPEEIHFHEVGGEDSIIDIVGVAYLINNLKIKNIYSSPAKFGHGIVKTEHGHIPVPAPATVEILKDFPFERIDLGYELTTPTGAAILKYYVKQATHNFKGIIKDIFYSTGTKVFYNTKPFSKKGDGISFEDPINLSQIYPNLLRIIRFEDPEEKEQLFIAETNLDDITPQHLGYLFDIIFEKGALDIFFTPIYMKKNRPAYKLSVIGEEKDKDIIIHTILKHTTTGGVRFHTIGRYELSKDFIELTYLGCKFRVKILSGQGIKKMAPEWEDIRENSEKLNIPTYNLYHEILKIVENKPL